MFKTIIKNKRNGILCLYPNVTNGTHKLETRKYTVEEINAIKLKLKKISNNVKITNITQTETFYKDLIKVDVASAINIDISHMNTVFVKKENNHILFENNLLVISNVVKINEMQFPSLVQYDHTVVKDIEIYKLGNIEILFVLCKPQITVYFDVSCVDDGDEKLFNLCMTCLVN